MSKAEELHAFLTDLPSREFETVRDYERESISEFLNILGYSSENIFYEVTRNLPQQQETTFFDAFVATSPDAIPWICLEVRKYTETSYPETGGQIDPHIFRDLECYQSITNAQYSVVLTNRALGVQTNDNQHGFNHETIGIDDCEWIVETLSSPGYIPEVEELSEKEAKDKPDEITTDKFSIDLETYRTRLKAVTEAKTNQEKKETLEDLAALLIQGVPQFSVHRRNLNTLSGEIDLVVENSDAQSAINCHSRYFLIECKNWADSVGADRVRDFTGKLQSAKSSLGILFAKNGISGPDSENAKKVINDTFQQDGIAVIVFDLNDLEQIAEGKSFHEFLEEKIFNRRFPT